MRSFAAIDRQLADAPPAIAVLLAAIEEVHGRELRLRAEAPQRVAGLAVAGGPPAAADALAAAGRGPLSVRTILHVHGVLLGETGTSVPVDGQAAMLLNELVARYELAVSQRRHANLLLVCALALDFATIRPFHAGNGRMTRLLVTRELLRHDCGVARFVSIDRTICDTLEQHDAALLASQVGWQASEHDVWPWVEYLLGLVAGAYEELERRVAASEPGRR